MFNDPISPEIEEFYQSISKLLLATNALVTIPPFIFKYIFTKQWKELNKWADKAFAFGGTVVQEKRKNLEKKLQAITDGDDQSDNRVDFLSYVIATRKLNETEANVAMIELLFAGIDTVHNQQ